MDKKDCFHLGEILKLHGLKGEVAAHLDVDDPSAYTKLEQVFLDVNGLLVPFFIENIKLRDYTAIIAFEDTGYDEAQDLQGLEMYLPLSSLPELSGNKFYFHEVSGFTVIDKASGEIGTITRVLDLPQQAVLQVDHNGKEVLIPVADHIILSVDRSLKQMHVDLPNGLLEVYL